MKHRTEPAIGLRVKELAHPAGKTLIQTSGRLFSSGFPSWITAFQTKPSSDRADAGKKRLATHPTVNVTKKTRKRIPKEETLLENPIFNAPQSRGPTIIAPRAVALFRKHSRMNCEQRSRPLNR